MKNLYNLNSLKRWSCKSKIIPDVSTIKAIHVYDFDNTLFSSPLPNPQLWSPPTIGFLQTLEAFVHGGWWHDPTILAATGDGIEKEQPRAWQGWWNEVIVELIQASMVQKDALTVLLTGRGETNFAELITQMVDSKKLDFDMVVLKPEVGPANQRFNSTMEFKQEFLRDLIYTYKHADEIKVYEDRTKHVKGFKDHFERLNKNLLSHPQDQPPPQRKPITADVIHVCELKSSLDPQTEVVVIQTAINRHNKAIKEGGPNPTRSQSTLLQIKENFIYFGYLINQHDSARLITLCNTPAHLIDSGEVRYMASSILITPYYPRKDTVEKVGGRGNKVTWQVAGIAKFEDRIWAVKVVPVTETQIHTTDETPMVVLAIRKGARPIDASKIKNWSPLAPEKQFVFETVVGDRMAMKIEEADDTMSRNRGKNGGYQSKRKYGQDDDQKENSNNSRDDGAFVPGGQQGGGGGRYFPNRQSKNAFNNRRTNFPQNGRKNDQAGGNDGNRQGGGRSRGGGGAGGGGGGGGRGGRNRGPPAYKSLDDYGPAGNFDGSGDTQTGGATGPMVMNY